MMFNTVQYPQGEKVSGSDDKTTHAAAILTIVTDSVAALNPSDRSATEPENQHVPVSVSPVTETEEMHAEVIL